MGAEKSESREEVKDGHEQYLECYKEAEAILEIAQQALGMELEISGVEEQGTDIIFHMDKRLKGRKTGVVKMEKSEMKIVVSKEGARIRKQLLQ